MLMCIESGGGCDVHACTSAHLREHVPRAPHPNGAGTEQPPSARTARTSHPPYASAVLSHACSLQKDTPSRHAVTY